MAWLYKQNGECEPYTGGFELEDLQKAVGGFIELVHIRNGMCLVIDEEGKLKGKDVNIKATELAKGSLIPGDFIVGDAVVCRRECIP